MVFIQYNLNAYNVQLKRQLALLDKAEEEISKAIADFMLRKLLGDWPVDAFSGDGATKAGIIKRKEGKSYFVENLLPTAIYVDYPDPSVEFVRRPRAGKFPKYTDSALEESALARGYDPYLVAEKIYYEGIKNPLIWWSILQEVEAVADKIAEPILRKYLI